MHAARRAACRGAAAAAPLAAVAAVPRHRLDDAARPRRRPGPRVLPLPADRQRPRRRPRSTQARQDALQGSRSAQTQFDATDNTDTDELTQLATDIAVPAGVARGRPVARRHPGAQRRTTPRRPRSATDPVRRRRPAEHPGRAAQGRRGRPRRASRRRSSRSPASRPADAVPAVVVGQQVDGPARPGRYELYFVYPMDRERGHPRARRPHLRRRRHRPDPARRRRRLRRHPPGRRPRAPRARSSPSGSPPASSTSG